MKKLILLSFTSLVLVPAIAEAKTDIFACEPEWGALAKEIGGDDVDVTTATTASQDPHHIKAKPSLLAAMRKADLVFCNGASLEVGWLPVLRQKAAGPKTTFLYAADYVEKLDVPAKVDRAMGDVHPDGNPHIVTDPRNISAVANALADKLAEVDPANAGGYKDRLAAFQAKWSGLISGWEKQAADLKGADVVVYHASWAYLLNWLGMNHVASLEPKPGIPPTAAHLEEVLASVKGKKIKAILVSPYDNAQAAEWLNEKTGIPIVHLPFTVGGDDTADSLENLYSETIRLLEGTGS
ncbi:MAG: zinc ABC transporter substrate-binding protein [Rhodospirillales bacterium]|nr:zinc ABC transporter substrate-binding protein [Alphaproteobacteria bacterium]MCB9976904.1 zinc ABC transporter substrate-binding protein [Rhodospirillales bacterium]